MAGNMQHRPKLLYLVSEDWYFVSHRLSLAFAAKEAGFDVSVATRVTNHGEEIRDAGLNLIPITLARSGLNPLYEARTISELNTVFARETPDLVHDVALKPVIYGAWAAHKAGVKGIVNALMGLGWVFSSDSLKARALRPFVRHALRRALSAPGTRTIVQNADDAALIANQKLAPRDSIRLIRGSGVNPADYAAEDAGADVPLVVLPARLLIAKGVREFINAAALLKAEGVKARFALVGEPDTDNPAAIPPEEILDAVIAGDVEHWGWRHDMPQVFSEASLVCLPTFYGEGVPKALIEAAASARAIVTTDVPGCREIVHPGENGWLVPPRDVGALATALRQAIAQPGLCAEFGGRGRRIVEREFSLDAVISDTLAVYGELVAMPPADLADDMTNIVPLRRAS
jgi:glycosyltransferase involved in cell wall biosynthesis